MAISGFQMPFLDSAGAAHPQSFWVPGTVTMDNLDQEGGIIWNGFHDAAHFLAHAQPVQGAVHPTSLAPALYAQIVSFPVAAGVYGTATATALDFLAENVLDTPAPPDAGGSPATNPDGTPKMVSFFASASVVTLGG